MDLILGILTCNASNTSKLYVSFELCKPKYKVKVKFTVERAMKTHRGHRGVAVLFL